MDLEALEEKEKAFNGMKKAIQRETEKQRTERDKPLRIVCDASKEGCEAVVQQNTG